MNLESENLRKYVIYNTDLKLGDEITIEAIESMDYLTIKRLNAKMEEAVFVPEELAYFKNIKTCGFSGFTIRDNIKENIEKLNKLNFIKFDHCRYRGKNGINNNIEDIELNCSEFGLFCMCNNKTNLKNVFLKDVEEVDVEEIVKYENIEKISLLNCEVKNANSLLKLNKLKTIRIIGSKLDNKEVVEKLKEKVDVTYSEEEYFPIG